ncbi:type 1 fimbria pilin [Pseudomonas sp. 3296]|uniref:fimbrial protein n=1 Tax=Pseudomonas sp. 3296 TaxID=2817753 RepID=UPI002854F6B4|nr:fimbrial protein [Pseudomonas sp. 3296]MDR6919015.1 type 1 fimbria pilin [Pseudomonas sp. 3296]
MKNNTLYIALSLVIMGVLSSKVSASCTISPSVSGPVVWALPATLSVKRNAAVGTVIYTQPWNNSGGPYASASNCSPSFYTYVQLVNAMTSTAVPNAYATNVAGIGVRMWANAGTSQYIPAYPNLNNKQGPYNNVPISQGFGFDLVITGPVNTGALTFGNANVARAVMSDSGAGILQNPYSYQYLQINGTTSIIASACTVDTQNVAVALPSLIMASLTGKSVGATFNPTEFNIALTCNTGIKVSYQIDGISSVYSQPAGVLNNSTGSGMATGVGIQILAGAGAKSPLPLSTKTLVATSISNNQPVSIPLVAQYYKTATTNSPGQVQALATFSMYYE